MRTERRFVMRMKTSVDLEGLIRTLEHKKATLRQRAVEALGELRDPRSVDALVAALADSDIRVRQAAAKAVGKLRDARVVGPLVERLLDESSQVRMTAAEGLGSLAESLASGPELAERGDKNARIWEKEGEVLSLSSCQPPQYCLRVFRLLACRKWIELAGLRSLAVAPLVSALFDADDRVRDSALSALKRIVFRGKAAPLFDAMLGSCDTLREKKA